MRPPCKNKQCFATKQKKCVAEKMSSCSSRGNAACHLPTPMTLWWAAELDFCTWAQECDICTARLINRLNINQNSFQHCRRKKKKKTEAELPHTLAGCTLHCHISNCAKFLPCGAAKLLCQAPPLSLRGAALIHAAHFKTNTPSLPALQVTDQPDVLQSRLPVMCD